MADNDEYHFADPDALGPESSSETEAAAQPAADKPTFFTMHAQLIRNALIVLSFFILCMLTYTIVKKIAAHREHKLQKPADMQVAPLPLPTATTPAAVTPPPVAPVMDIPSKSPAVDQKISDVAQSQETIQADVLSIQTQISNLDNNVNNLANRMMELNQQLEAVTSHLSEQERSLEKFLHPVVVKHHVKKHKVIHKPKVKYYVEAIMPGRAWLMSSTGTTITVRKGSPIPGYGIVKLIDDRQGRVRTSTGAVICFSQDDS